MEKKIMILIFLLIVLNKSFAQPDKQPDITLTFDTDFFDAVDHWVVLSEKTNGAFLYGYVYIDDTTGFTFVLESTFTVKADGKQQYQEARHNYLIKKPLDKNTGKVCVLSEKNIQELHLPDKPEWLRIYETDLDTAPRLSKKGYHYNAVGCSKSAIPFLEKAYQTEPHTNGLEFQLAVAYNATGNYQKAIDVMQAAIAFNPRNYMLFRELGFALFQSGKPDAAEQVYVNGLNYCKTIDEKCEMCLDLVKTYAALGDKSKFEKWIRNTKRYAMKGSEHLKNLESYESNTSP